MTVADMLLSLAYALLLFILARALVYLKRTFARVRRHRMFANRRFMRRYRAEQPKNSRTIVKAYLPSLLSPIGPTPRTGRCGRAPAAPAGSSQELHAA